MKLPFNTVVAPVMKRYFHSTKKLCVQPAFHFSIPYTYFFSFLGMIISINHLRKHVGEKPSPSLVIIESIDDLEQDFMLVHDLKIIATSMGFMQYACLFAGCYTENPALFLPHLACQIIIVAIKIMNVMLIFTSMKKGSRLKLFHRIPAIIMMTFNWLQEFCVFRQFLCLCDL